jgi:uncharacterized membrane protein
MLGGNKVVDLETEKKVFWVAIIVSIAVIVFGVIMMAINGDLHF